MLQIKYQLGKKMKDKWNSVMCISCSKTNKSEQKRLQLSIIRHLHYIGQIQRWTSQHILSTRKQKHRQPTTPQPLTVDWLTVDKPSPDQQTEAFSVKLIQTTN